MEEVYKVVGTKERYGSNATGWAIQNDKPFEDFFKLNPDLKESLTQYFPKYEKGKVIKAVKGSVGILCFESRAYAENFEKDYIYLWGSNSTMIIKVIGLGKRRKLEYIIGCGMQIKILISSDINNTDFIDPPDGTVAFTSVRVLE